MNNLSNTYDDTTAIIVRNKIKVAIVCHIWSHYREPVGKLLMESEHIDYHIYSSGEKLDGIEHAKITHLSNFHRSTYRYFGKVLWQGDAVRLALSKEYDALVLLGDPNFLSTWLGALVCRMRHVPCFYWTHGWLREETGARRVVRGVFYRLASKLLLYSERGKVLGAASGFPESKMTVIYNSLDAERARDIVRRIEGGGLTDINPRDFFAEANRPLLICTGRLTEKVGLDLLFDAAAELDLRGRPVNILLVGDGVERDRLESRAQAEGLSVHFFGACYREELVGQLIYRSDLTVAPGKLGLTAMHTLMYGTPAVTHGDFDHQMPEVEALVEGVTGAFFRRGDAADLANVIDGWLSRQTDRAAIRRAAFREIEAKWTPKRQAEIIERAILEIVNVAG